MINITTYPEQSSLIVALAMHTKSDSEILIISPTSQQAAEVLDAIELQIANFPELKFDRMGKSRLSVGTGFVRSFHIGASLSGVGYGRLKGPGGFLWIQGEFDQCEEDYTYIRQTVFSRNNGQGVPVINTSNLSFEP